MKKSEQWFKIIVFQTLASILWLLLIPKEPRNALILGYSLRRLAMVIPMSLPFVFLVLFRWGLKKSEKWRTWLIDDKNKPKIAVFLAVCGFLLAAAAWTSVFLFHFLGLFPDLAAFIRLLPFLVTYLLLGVEAILFVPLALYPFKTKNLGKKHFFSRAAFQITFAGFIIVFMVVGITGWGINPEQMSIISGSAPLLKERIWFIAGLLALLIEASFAWAYIPKDSRPVFRWKIDLSEKWKNALLILFSVVFTLLMGEIVLQANYRIKNQKWLWENTAFEVNYIIPTNDSRQYTLRPDYYDIEQNMPINQWGERITLQPENYEDTRNVIVCLGDSVPFGAGIGNNDTYPFYLAQDLENEGFKYYVINAGVPSYNLSQSFERLKLDVYNHVDAKDVKVVTLQVSNDISMFMYYRENWTPELTWADVRFNFHPIPFSNQLAISHYISQIVSQPRGSSKIPISDLIVQNMSLLLKQKLTELRNTNPEVIVILLPSNPFYYQLTNSEKNSALKFWSQYGGTNSSLVESWDQYVRDFNSVLLDVSKNFDNVFFLDVRDAMDKQDRDNFFVDFIHLSAEGSKFQANLVTEFLVENDLLQK
jgi:hypothetical protein